MDSNESVKEIEESNVKRTSRFIYKFVDGKFENNLYSQVLAYMIVGTIIIGFVSSFLESVPAFKFTPQECDNPACSGDPYLCPGRVICQPVPFPIFSKIDMTIIYILTGEYCAKFLTVWAVSARDADIVPSDWTADEDPSYDFLEHYLRYIISIRSIIDIITFLPYYFGFALHGHGSLVFVRILRLFRLFRLFRLLRVLHRYKIIATIFRVILCTIKESLSALGVVAAIILLVMIFFGCIIFSTEGGTYMVTEKYPEGQYMRATLDGSGLEISPYTSIPTSFYWVLVTFFTVGCGDLFPTSWTGRMIANVAMFVGMVSMAFPISVIGEKFTEMYHESVILALQDIGKAFHINSLGDADMEELFKEFDEDGNGFISIVEMQKAFEKTGLTMSESQVHETLSSVSSSVDRNLDGEITLDEFKNMCYFIQGKNRAVEISTTPRLFPSSRRLRNGKRLSALSRMGGNVWGYGKKLTKSISIVFGNEPDQAQRDNPFTNEFLKRRITFVPSEIGFPTLPATTGKASVTESATLSTSSVGSGAVIPLTQSASKFNGTATTKGQTPVSRSQAVSAAMSSTTGAYTSHHTDSSGQATTAAVGGMDTLQISDSLAAIAGSTLSAISLPLVMINDLAIDATRTQPPAVPPEHSREYSFSDFLTKWENADKKKLKLELKQLGLKSTVSAGKVGDTKASAELKEIDRILRRKKVARLQDKMTRIKAEFEEKVRIAYEELDLKVWSIHAELDAAMAELDFVSGRHRSVYAKICSATHF